MEHRFRLTRQAARDIDEIWDYIADQSQSEKVAERAVAKVFREFARLSEFPEAGYLREDLTDKRFKFWTVFQYLIVYRPESSPIEIVAEVSASRDLTSFLDER